MRNSLAPPTRRARLVISDAGRDGFSKQMQLARMTVVIAHQLFRTFEMDPGFVAKLLGELRLHIEG